MTYYPLIAAISANIVAQCLKPVFNRLFTKHWNIKTIKESGGFPSSHAASVVALVISIGIKDGLDSSVFAISLVVALIICYDAANVRYYAGQNIQLTQQLIKDLQVLFNLELNSPVYLTEIKRVLGHKWIEVFGGAIVGILVSLMVLLLV